MKINFTKLFICNYLYILILEFIFKFFVLETYDIGILYIIIFNLPLSCLLTGLMSLSKKKIVNRIASYFIWFVLLAIYVAETMYYSFYRAVCGFEALMYSDQAADFADAILVHMWNDKFILLGMVIPFILLIILSFKCIEYSRCKFKYFCALFISTLIMCVTSVELEFNNVNNSSTILYDNNELLESTNRFGLIDSVLINGYKLMIGFEDKISGSFSANYTLDEDKLYNVTYIDWNTLKNNTEDETVKTMHDYFSSIEPSNQNKYTGIFAGKNLIFITAEGFYPIAVNEEYTPTLYKLANSSFIFENYYQPLYNCSTSDGEFVNMLSILPGVSTCSMTSTIGNYLPYSLGNILDDYGYNTYAFHGWTYSYYKRNITYPNLGYTYYAYDTYNTGYEYALSGIKYQWPTSDIDVVNSSMNIYMNDNRFMTYYMSISGHLQYNFSGNAMAIKNKSLVENLDASDSVKAYLATQIEFDKSMEILLNTLEENGKLDDTVIVIAPDHYPYGLTTDEINDYTGTIDDENFDLYKNTLIIYNPSIEGIKVDKYMGSIDVLPTILNLFGVTYDSRLLMGNDIFSDKDSLVIFNNKSWITDKGRYNYVTGKFESFGEDVSQEYIDNINKQVELKFKMSKLLISKDYYRKVFGDK